MAWRRSDTARVVGAASFGLAAACSWSRFDDIEENPPVELLEQPDELRFGFGNSVTVASEGENVVGLVTGIAPFSRGASFQLGQSENTATASSDRNYCTSGGDEVCALASSPAGLGRAWSPDGEKRLCFALGLGAVGGDSGVVLRCDGGAESALPVPEGVAVPTQAPQVAIDKGVPIPDSVLAVDRDEAPSLLASSPSQARAWKYEPLSKVPEELVPPQEVSAGYGRTLAVARVNGARVYAVGDPDAGSVWLFRGAAGKPAAPLGCLSSPGLGRSLAAGAVDEADGDELLLTDDAGVLVLSGAALASAAPAKGVPCGADWLPAKAWLGAIGCEEVAQGAGCVRTEFGAALAVADLDGDGSGEVIVGAPNLDVRGESGAGAVFVYDFREGEPVLVDTRILSSVDSGDRLGASIAVAPQRTREVLLVGAPGRNAAVVLYCNALASSGSRCR